MLLILNFLTPNAYAVAPEDLLSKSAILINADDGQVLLKKQQ